jgi:hypothetical protein
MELLLTEVLSRGGVNAERLWPEMSGPIRLPEFGSPDIVPVERCDKSRNNWNRCRSFGDQGNLSWQTARSVG